MHRAKLDNRDEILVKSSLNDSSGFRAVSNFRQAKNATNSCALPLNASQPDSVLSHRSVATRLASSPTSDRRFGNVYRRHEGSTNREQPSPFAELGQPTRQTSKTPAHIKSSTTDGHSSRSATAPRCLGPENLSDAYLLSSPQSRGDHVSRPGTSIRSVAFGEHASAKRSGDDNSASIIISPTEAMSRWSLSRPSVTPSAMTMPTPSRPLHSMQGLLQIQTGNKLKQGRDSGVENAGGVEGGRGWEILLENDRGLKKANILTAVRRVSAFLREEQLKEAELASLAAETARIEEEARQRELDLQVCASVTFFFWVVDWILLSYEYFMHSKSNHFGGDMSDVLAKIGYNTLEFVYSLKFKHCTSVLCSALPNPLKNLNHYH